MWLQFIVHLHNTSLLSTCYIQKHFPCYAVFSAQHVEMSSVSLMLVDPISCTLKAPGFSPEIMTRRNGWGASQERGVGGPGVQFSGPEECIVSQLSTAAVPKVRQSSS